MSDKKSEPKFIDLNEEYKPIIKEELRLFASRIIEKARELSTWAIRPRGGISFGSTEEMVRLDVLESIIRELTE